MTISELARQAGVSVETVRYYEREALIDQPPKPRSGYRQYSAAHLERIRFLKRCQAAGFTLAEATSLAIFVDQGMAGCAPACELATQKLAELRSRIAQYQQLANQIAALIDDPACCEVNQSCTLLEAFRNEQAAET